ncbi:MAG: type II toxin-antitoxin system RelE/ParE family toxin [Anaerolineae bacterium]|nr:type II toxin-antitoxin system RelE/ParE family toxin [Anaerolineae bacterium]
MIFRRQAEKALRRLPRDLLRRIERAISDLAEDPRPSGCVRLVGYGNMYRIRVGDWRISYAVEDEQLVILIVKIAPRGSAYRNL